MKELEGEKKRENEIHPTVVIHTHQQHLLKQMKLHDKQLQMRCVKLCLFCKISRIVE